jgi:hypothetical protein
MNHAFEKKGTVEMRVFREAAESCVTVAHACRKRRLKWIPGAWGYNWATQSPGDINMES